MRNIVNSFLVLLLFVIVLMTNVRLSRLEKAKSVSFTNAFLLVDPTPEGTLGYGGSRTGSVFTVVPVEGFITNKPYLKPLYDSTNVINATLLSGTNSTSKP